MTVHSLVPTSFDVVDFNHPVFNRVAECFNASTPNMRRVVALTVGVAMVALTAVVAYYLLSTSFFYLDFGYKASHGFLAGLTLYMGSIYAGAGACNVFYTAVKICMGDLTGRKAVRQIGNTLLLPIHPRFLTEALRWACIFACILRRSS